MTIKQQGGIFGRNPDFSNVTIDELEINNEISSEASPLTIKRPTTNGDIISVEGSSGTVGSLGIQPSGFYIDGEANHVGLRFGGFQIEPRNNGADVDNYTDLGSPSGRFNDIYLGGAVYLGGTSWPNRFDDYEEGIFTPTVVGTSATGVGTYSIQVGRYTKIGNRVVFNITLGWSAHTGTGDMNVAGLPFASNSTANNSHSISPYFFNLALSSGYTLQSFIGPSSTEVGLRQVPTGGGSAIAIPIDTSVNFLIFSGSYEV